MSPPRNISIARDFSRLPAGRYVADGSTSGQTFREKFLLPSLKAGEDVVVVDLDGTEGYGSSFLEEAFGGLVRAGYSSHKLRQRLKFLSNEDPSLVDEILSYIDEAQQKLNH